MVNNNSTTESPLYFGEGIDNKQVFEQRYKVFATEPKNVGLAGMLRPYSSETLMMSLP